MSEYIRVEGEKFDVMTPEERRILVDELAARGLEVSIVVIPEALKPVWCTLDEMREFGQRHAYHKSIPARAWTCLRHSADEFPTQFADEGTKIDVASLRHTLLELLAEGYNANALLHGMRNLGLIGISFLANFTNQTLGSHRPLPLWGNDPTRPKKKARSTSKEAVKVPPSQTEPKMNLNLLSAVDVAGETRHVVTARNITAYAMRQEYPMETADFDALIEALARRVPSNDVVMIHSEHPHEQSRYGLDPISLRVALANIETGRTAWSDGYGRFARRMTQVYLRELFQESNATQASRRVIPEQ